MTQVAMIFEEEKRQAVEQAVEAERKKALDLERRAVEAERKKALDLERRAVEAEKKAFDSQRQVVLKMIENGYSTEEITFLIENYSTEEVDALRKK